MNFLKRVAQSDIVSFYIKFISVNFIPLSLIITTWLKVLYFNVEIGTFFRDKTMFATTFATVVLFFTFSLLSKKYKNISAIIAALFLTLVVLANLVNVRYFGSLITLAALSIAGVTDDVGSAVLELVFVTDLFLFLDIFIALILRKKLKFIRVKYDYKKSVGLVLLGITALSSLTVFIFYRDRDLYVSRFLNSVYDSKIITERYGLLSVYGFEIYKANLKPKDMSPEKKTEIIDWVKNNKIASKEPNEMTGVAKDKRIIMVQFESLENFVINKSVEGQEITPNLNKLVSESTHFNNNYFNIGLGNTSDSDLVSNASVFPLQDAATFIRYGKNDFQGLAEIMNANGYNTSSYHAYNKSFWNRGEAHQSLGYENIFFSEKYNGETVGMGTNDTDFFKSSVDLIKEQKAPSFNFLITLSSHYPFILPEGYETPFSSTEPFDLRNYYNSVHYADKAFGTFVEKLKEEGLYDDSLIVVYGDHLARKGEIDYSQFLNIFDLSPSSERAKNEIESKRTPLIFKFPNENEKKTINQVSSTIDIMPTVLNLASIETERPMFGRDLFSNEKPFFASNFYFENGFVMDDKKVFIFGSTADSEGTCYKIENLAWKSTESNQCQALINRRNKEQEVSSYLIKFDLLKDFAI